MLMVMTSVLTTASRKMGSWSDGVAIIVQADPSLSQLGRGQDPGVEAVPQCQDEGRLRHDHQVDESGHQQQDAK